jgi:hypothetical protein
LDTFKMKLLSGQNKKWFLEFRMLAGYMSLKFWRKKLSKMRDGINQQFWSNIWGYL